MSTPCKDCTFAIYEGITQTGCSRDRLKLYKENEIVEAYDEEREFYVVNGQCLYYRPHEWRKKVENAGLTVDERLAVEVIFPYEVVLICGENEEDILSTLKSLEEQEQPPKRITFVTPLGCKYDLRNLIPKIRELKIQWFTRQIINKSHVGRQRIIDLCITKQSMPYFTVVDAGFIVPPETFKILGDKVINERFTFGAIAPNSTEQGMVIPYSVYQHYKIHMPSHGTIDALKEDDECEQIYPITEIVPSFPR